jgi:peptide deformylase
MSEKKFKVVNGETYEYVLYKRVDPNSDILKQKLEPFNFSKPPVNPRELAVSLIETMVKYRGVGLAANQVGLPYRVFVMGAEKVGFACFNPEILERSGEEIIEEGCISFPGLYLKIPRAASINVRYTDMNGVTKEERFDGLTARIFQHELDHLDGICYTSKVSRLVLERAKEKVKINLKKVNKLKKAYEDLNQLKEKSEKLSNKIQKITEAPKKETPAVFEYNVG